MLTGLVGTEEGGESRAVAEERPREGLSHRDRSAGKGSESANSQSPTAKAGMPTARCDGLPGDRD